MEDVKVTKTGGYFNGNSFPISLSISHLGVTLTLSPGQYITAADEAGKKHRVNDPMFERYVGKSRLSKELLQNDVPVVRMRGRAETKEGQTLRATVQMTGHDGHGKPGQPIFKTGEKLVVPSTRVEPAPNPLPLPIEAAPTRRGGITAMSMQEAIKSGRVRPLRPLEMKGPADTDGITPRVDVQSVQTLAEGADDLPASVVSGTAAPVRLEINPDPMPSVPPVSSPDQTHSPSVAEIAESEKMGVGFICEACSPAKTFPFRSVYENHVKRAHIDLVEELMAKYPKKSKSA